MSTESVFKIGPSSVSGDGVIATKPITKDTVIGTPLYVSFYIFPIIIKGLGTKINHSWTANAHLIKDAAALKWHLVASKNIKRNEEITVDYRRTPWFIDGPKANYV